MNPGAPARTSLLRAAVTVALLSVLALTSTCVQRACAAVVVPNHTEFTFTVPEGGFSNPITLPVNNSPIMVTGATITADHRGTGSMHITHANGAPASITWTGEHFGGASTSGERTTATNEDILVCGTGALSHGPNLNQLRAHNSQVEGFSLTMVVELVW